MSHSAVMYARSGQKQAYKVSMLSQAAHRIMTQELGRARTSEELALAALMVYEKLLAHLYAVIGEGNHALFRFSLRRTRTTFTCFTEVRATDPDAVLNEVRVCLHTQEPDMARQASIALFMNLIELLATFIGPRITWQILHAAWPNILDSSPEELYP
jgi:hypothetical protein